MAIQTMPAPLVIRNEPSGGIVTQVMKVFIQPKAFFRAMPANRQWLFIALLVLAISGFTATRQVQSTSSSNASSNTSSQTTGFDLSLLNQSATSSQTTQSTTTQQTQTNTTAATSSSLTSSVSSDTTLMNALIAASGIIVMWAGQAVLLSLVTMLLGYSPQIGRTVQIVVWASLPLAFMLVLRSIHYATGGSGGSLGLSLLLSQWSGYAALPQFLRRVLAVFMGNMTLFWLWNLALLYFGARYALNGKRWSVALVVAMWILAATFVPALVSDPQTRVTAMPSSASTTVQQTTTQSTTSTATTAQQSDTFGGGQFPGGGGAPPAGGFPGG